MIWLALGITWVPWALVAGLLIWRKEKRFYRWAVVLAVVQTAIILVAGQMPAAVAFRIAVNYSAVFTGCIVISLAIETLLNRRRRKL